MPVVRVAHSFSSVPVTAIDCYFISGSYLPGRGEDTALSNDGWPEESGGEVGGVFDLPQVGIVTNIALYRYTRNGAVVVDTWYQLYRVPCTRDQVSSQIPGTRYQSRYPAFE